MNTNSNFVCKTPGRYKVFFFFLSSLLLDAVSHYDAMTKAQAAYPGRNILRILLISQTRQAYQTTIAIQSLEAKANPKPIQIINPPSR